MAKIVKQKDLKRKNISEITVTSDVIGGFKGKLFPVADMIFAIKEKLEIEISSIQVSDSFHSDSKKGLGTKFRKDVSYTKLCEHLLKMRENKDGDCLGTVSVDGFYDGVPISIVFSETESAMTLHLDEAGKIDDLRKFVEILQL